MHYSHKNFFNNVTALLLILTAPCAYDVEKAEKVTQQSTGAVTFGIKYKEPKPDEIPGTFL